MREQLKAYILSFKPGALCRLEQNLLKDHPNLHQFVLDNWDANLSAKHFLEKAYDYLRAI